MPRRKPFQRRDHPHGADQRDPIHERDAGNDRHVRAGDPGAGQATVCAGRRIVVRIHNGLATPIFARDERSDCTLVDLERWVNGSWQAVAPCVNMVPKPTIIQFAPGTALTQQLAPGQSDSLGDAWPAGTYRIAFAYVTSAGQPFGQSTVVYSASFTIG